MTIETEIAERLARATPADSLRGYAPGRYMNICCSCGGGFFGSKYAVQCFSCACLSVFERTALLARVEELKAALRRYGRHSCCTIAIEGRCTCGLAALRDLGQKGQG